MPLIQRLNLFVRRRRKVMLSTFAGLVLAALLVIGLLPYDYTAQTNLGTNSMKGYDGPVHQLIARVTSHTVLLEVAKASKLAQPLGVGAHLAGVPIDPAERLGAQVQIHGLPGAVERLAVTAHGSSGEAARTASQQISERLVAFDRQLRRLSLAQRVSGEEPTAEVGEATRVQLEGLRQRFPLLRDRILTERHQSEASAIAEEEIALAAQRGRVLGYEAKVRGLEQQVREEAARAYEADLAVQARVQGLKLEEDRREAERRAALAGRDEQESAARSSGSPAPSSLEGQLNSLRSRYTDRHPEVRRILREIELAKQNQTKPAAEPTEVESRPISDPQALGSLLITDGDEEQPPAAAPGPMPTYWLHKAPSYVMWIEAKNQVAEERLQLQVRERSLASRSTKHSALTKTLQGLEAARLDEQRLLAKIKEEELVQGRASDLPPLHQPLLLGEQARVVSVVSPWRGFPLALFLSLVAAMLAGWLAEIQDRSFHLASEVTQRVDLPVLGVIPHLRGR